MNLKIKLAMIEKGFPLIMVFVFYEKKSYVKKKEFDLIIIFFLLKIYLKSKMLLHIEVL
tara:strand:+ start:484 stop:660 length:177 start_codon:yes stop_codon:yes gene_type:complete